jgi:hypothetical protein
MLRGEGLSALQLQVSLHAACVQGTTMPAAAAAAAAVAAASFVAPWNTVLTFCT